MKQDLEKYVEEFGNTFYPTVGYNRYHEEAEWLRATLTTYAEEIRREVLRQVMDAHRAEYEAIQKLFPDVDSNSAQILS